MLTAYTVMSAQKPHNTSLCEACHARPKFQDTSTGTTHPYCGKGCAALAKTHGTCSVCHNKPRYFDGTTLHPYCGKKCAQKSQPSVGKGFWGKSKVSNTMPANACQIPGCAAPKFNGSEYCGRTHQSLAKVACLMCLRVAKQGDRHFCGRSCEFDAQKKAVMLLEVPGDHVTFLSVEAQFKASWRNQGLPYRAVRRVYKIVSSQTSLDLYDAYKAKVELNGNFVAAGRSAGNENRRWHGTKRECTLGDQGQTQFCTSANCALCNIIKNSLDITKARVGRFGAGIYTSSTSSTSWQYASNSVPNAPLKALLLNRVVVGKRFKQMQDDNTLKAPPAGYDSVLCEAPYLGTDELVVYDNDAIRPSYLIMCDAK